MKLQHLFIALPLCGALLMNQKPTSAQYGVPRPVEKVVTWRDLGADTWVATDKLGRKLPLGGAENALCGACAAQR